MMTGEPNSRRIQAVSKAIRIDERQELAPAGICKSHLGILRGAIRACPTCDNSRKIDKHCQLLSFRTYLGRTGAYSLEEHEHGLQVCSQAWKSLGQVCNARSPI